MRFSFVATLSSLLRHCPTPCSASIGPRFVITCSNLSQLFRDTTGSPGLPYIPNIQHAIVSDPEEVAQHLPDALCQCGFHYPNGVALPIGVFEAQYVQLMLTACCLAPSVLNLWDYSRRPRVLYPVTGLSYRNGIPSRWNIRPCPAALWFRYTQPNLRRLTI